MTEEIVLDGGHGGKDPGAEANGLQEKNITLTLSEYTKDYLDDNYTGHRTRLTRSKDVFLELEERADIANKYNADVFASFHVNAAGGTGYESYIYTKPDSATIDLQNMVNDEALRTAKKYGLGPHGEDKKRGNLAVVRETKMPAILTEICFIDSKDAALLKKDDFLRDMAAAYARGLARFVGLQAKKKAVNIASAADKEYYTVVKGDTVSKIAKKYDVTIDQIKQWNKLDDKYTIRIGQKLRVK